MIAGEKDTEDTNPGSGNVDQENLRSPFTILMWIMIGVLVWGSFHAIGVYVSAREPNILKPIIVYGCVLGFLGFWAMMLWFRSRHTT